MDCRYCWTGDISEQAGVAYTDNYKVHLNAANPITQSFPTCFLRSQSLTGLTGHEVGHLLILISQPTLFI